jgi:hypothetical protein
MESGDQRLRLTAHCQLRVDLSEEPSLVAGQDVPSLETVGEMASLIGTLWHRSHDLKVEDLKVNVLRAPSCQAVRNLECRFLLLQLQIAAAQMPTSLIVEGHHNRAAAS